MPILLPDLPYDILHDVCRIIYQCNWSDGSLKNLSVTCKDAREAARNFLFRRIAVEHGWDVDALRALHELDAIKTHVRIFIITLRSRTVKYAARLGVWQQRQTPLPVARVREYFDLFPLFLGSLPHLEDLTIHDRFIDDAEVMSSLRTALQRGPVPLPKVRVLRIPDAAMALHKGCASLEAVALDITQPSVLRADWPGAPAPGIVRLELTVMRTGSWDDDALASELSQAVQQTMPSIRYLALLSADEYSVEALIPRFGGLAHLHTLALEELEDLGLDYKEHFDFGLPGIFVDEDAEEREQQRLEAVRRVKRAARKTFPALSRLWVGQRTLFDFTQLAPDSGPDALDALEAVTAYSREALA